MSRLGSATAFCSSSITLESSLLSLLRRNSYPVESNFSFDALLLLSRCLTLWEKVVDSYE